MPDLFLRSPYKLHTIDKCTVHGHYTNLMEADYAGKPYNELAGHPLPCSQVNSHCESHLRILNAAATHARYPALGYFIRQLGITAF